MFTEVTEAESKRPIYLDANHIISLQRVDGRTLIQMRTGLIKCDETPEEILSRTKQQVIIAKSLWGNSDDELVDLLNVCRDNRYPHYDLCLVHRFDKG